MDIPKLQQAFERKGYTFHYFDSAEQAADYLNQSIDQKTVGFGDSHTLLETGLYELLQTHNTVFSPMHMKEGQTSDEAATECVPTQIYLLSVNGASEQGEMVNIDGHGNRVSCSLFGHEKVYFVFGTNKIAPTLEQAIWRARNIAAPINAKRLGYQTPCAVKGDRCYDCNSPDRICNVMALHLHKLNRSDVEVVVIGQELGF